MDQQQSSNSVQNIYPTPQDEKHFETSPEPKKSGGLKWLWIILLIAVLGAGGYLIYTKYLNKTTFRQSSTALKPGWKIMEGCLMPRHDTSLAIKFQFYGKSDWQLDPKIKGCTIDLENWGNASSNYQSVVAVATENEGGQDTFLVPSNKTYMIGLAQGSPSQKLSDEDWSFLVKSFAFQ